jgi:hypothetical protein
LTFPPGFDLTRIAITDPDGKTVASGEWRPVSTDSPATWDAAVAKLGYRRTGSRWLSTGAGFATEVEPVEGGHQVPEHDDLLGWDEEEEAYWASDATKLKSLAELQRLVEEAKANKEGGAAQDDA